MNELLKKEGRHEEKRHSGYPCDGFAVGVVAARWGGEEPKLDPVLVTAEKRTENVQKCRSADRHFRAADQGLGHPLDSDVARQVPNLFIANWVPGQLYAFIRGIGAVNNDPAIGFYVDDVNYMDSRVFDTNPSPHRADRRCCAGRRDVVRKEQPGGRQYRREKPDNEFHYGLEQSAMKTLRDDALHARAAHQDKLFFGVSGTSEQMDGYNTNDFWTRRWIAAGGSMAGCSCADAHDKLDVTANVDGERSTTAYSR